MFDVTINMVGAKAFNGAVVRLAGSAALLKRLNLQVCKKEANFMRARVVEGIRNQAPAGKPFRPLNEWTVATRRLFGFRGSKALIERADLMKSIKVVRVDDRTYACGVPTGAVNSEGKDLVKIAMIQELGAGPIFIHITPKMRRFLAMVARKAKRPLPPARFTKPGYIVVHIPARPFLRPVYEKYGAFREISKRLDDYAAVILHGLWD